MASLLAALAALLGGGSIAQAQSAASGLTPTRTAEPSVERLFGDWGGVQPTLEASGITLQVGAIAEVEGNVSGGTRQGVTSANQLGVNLDIDFERLSGIEGFSTHFILVNRSGSSDSVLFGDHLLPVQEIYGSGGNVGVHLVSAYGEENLLNGRFDVTFGRMNVENDFASSPLYCNFTNNALCGDPKAAPGGDIGHSAYPDAVWAARLRIHPTQQTYFKVGVYEVDQGLYSDKDRTGFEFNISQASGVYIPVEFGWEPDFGQAVMPGNYKLGVGYDSSSGYKDFTAQLPSLAPGFSDRTHTGNLQVWGLADQMLVRNGPGADQGLIVLAGFILNNPNHTAYAQQYYVGLIEKGFLKTRRQDGLSILFTYVSISPNLINVEQVQQEFHVPLSNNATGLQSHEALVEVDYNIHVFRGVNFRPDFQYVLRPNAQANIRNAPVLGFHTDVQF